MAKGGRGEWASLQPLIARAMPPLSREQEAELIRAAQAGDSAARERLIASNIRFAAHMASRYAGRGAPLEDLVQEALVGLSKGIQDFDFTKGRTLRTYAAWWIKARLFRHLKRGQASVVASPTRYVATRPLDYSLDVPVGDDSDLSFKDLLEDPDEDPGKELDRSQLCAALRGKLDRLKFTPIQQRVLGRLCSDEPETHAEIGADFDLSRERIRQIEKALIEDLRQYLADFAAAAA